MFVVSNLCACRPESTRIVRVAKIGSSRATQICSSTFQRPTSVSHRLGQESYVCSGLRFLNVAVFMSPCACEERMWSRTELRDELYYTRRSEIFRKQLNEMWDRPSANNTRPFQLLFKQNCDFWFCSAASRLELNVEPPNKSGDCLLTKLHIFKHGDGILFIYKTSLFQTRRWNSADKSSTRKGDQKASIFDWDKCQVRRKLKIINVHLFGTSGFCADGAFFSFFFV